MSSYFVKTVLEDKIYPLNVHKTTLYSILKVPKNPHWAFWEIQDGVQDDR